MTVQLTEEQRQIILHALAHLAVDRPLWDAKLIQVALAMDEPSANGVPPLFLAFKLQEICPLTCQKSPAHERSVGSANRGSTQPALPLGRFIRPVTKAFQTASAL